MYLYHMTTIANKNYFCYHETKQQCARGQYQNTKRNSVQKNSKRNRFVYFAYEVRISCKGPLSAALYVYCYLENHFFVFQTAAHCLNSDVSIEYVTAPVSLTESVFM